MIKGQVKFRSDVPNLEARISIDVAGDNRVFQTMEAVIDTGFTGSLSLPESLVRELGLHSGRTQPVTLADGQTIQTLVYTARLLWHGQSVEVRVQTMGNEPMIGTALLADSRLIIDWWDGGDVVIEEGRPPAE